MKKNVTSTSIFAFDSNSWYLKRQCHIIFAQIFFRDSYPSAILIHKLKYFRIYSSFTVFNICNDTAESLSREANLTERIVQGVQRCHEPGELIFFDDFDDIDFDIWDHEITMAGNFTRTIIHDHLPYSNTMYSAIILNIFWLRKRALPINVLSHFFWPIWLKLSEIARNGQSGIPLFYFVEIFFCY